jgi:hypothetical protein
MKNNSLSKFWIILVAVLVLASVNGLIYVFLMPPWQHYDEPNHFEYAWWLANYGEKPTSEDYDQEMRREVLRSMIEHNFFRGLGYVPDPNTTEGPVWIGQQSQFDEPILYYGLASIPLYLMRGAEIDVQLYTARLVSLALLLVAVACGYGVMCELTAPGNPLRWIVPVSMALLPGFVELMTAVNNDAAAVAAGSLGLWAAVRLVKKGIGSWNLALAGAGAVFCAFSKETAYPVILILMAAVLLAILRSKMQRIVAWVLIGTAVLVICVLSFSWGDAALWYRNTNQRLDTRLVTEQEGEIFQLQSGPLDNGTTGSQLEQLIPAETMYALRGQPVTIGAWVWSQKAGDRVRLALTAAVGSGGYQQGTEIFTLDDKAAFYAFQAAMPEDATQSWVTITAEGETVVYLDRVVMAAGSFPVNEAPIENTWGGATYANSLRGKSAEDAWPRVRSWVDRVGSKVLPGHGRPSIVIYSLLDREAAGWYYVETMQNMLQTFWGKFGWGHVPLLGEKSYWVLGIITLVGLLGLAFGFQKGMNKLPWSALALLWAAMAMVWGLAIVRGVFYLFGRTFIPSARYAFPVIIPTVGLLCLGWWALWRRIGKLLRLPGWIGVAGYGVFVFCLNLLSLVTIWQYYYG